jgi:NAD(P)-dependent dehydrogenase (short-subunit alcohol dehydrogenase family)
LEVKMSDLENKVVLITGAVGNLGAAVANRFLASGAALVLLDHGTGRLRSAFQGLEESKNHLLLEGVDVGSPADMQMAVDKTLQRFGRIDILVNTVGGYQAGKPLYQTPLETWQKMLDLNARTVFVACQAVIPSMIRQHDGKIVSVSARSALAGGASMSAYSASKSAVVRLTETMAAELKPEGINVNCVLPGTIDTPQNRAEMPKADYSRWVSADSIAGVILFLSSDDARDIHGAAVPVYGRS